ncbi:PAS domain S-box-containing protein [Halopelagius inordinatus]|uniref:histidine kinase n=1 Tax=Halopelagius inordinatus TaxID=553467 RepID=A0A1I2T2Z5_9EURY|nr:histidine kinase N-terminal 7TM domain-containing protein [Halopelagius inordinatus]SFG59465.1 PAS domain S-box-containing protein [Halopelagius inordinatus]
MLSVTLLPPVLLVTVAVGTTAAFLAWRERPEPGVVPLVAMLAGQCWWSACLIFQVQATTLESKVFWVNLSWIGVVVIPVAWLLFALQYTGRDQYVRPRYVALLSLIPVATVVIALTSQSHDLLYTESTLVLQNGNLRLVQGVGSWFWVITGYTYLLGLFGSVPLLGLVRSDSLPFRGQSIALLVGTLAPWASNALFLVGIVPLKGLDPTPISFAVSGVAYLGALTRFRLLGTNPSPNRRARRLVFQRMQEAAIVVDSHDYVVDVNESAAETLGVTPREILGSPAQTFVPGYDDLPEDGSASSQITLDGTNRESRYDATVTQINDFRGRVIGRVITLHDISEHIRQQQRLEVLNRVLRHNIRTETNLIAGYADLMEGDDNDPRATTVKEHAANIAEMGEKAREISNIFERGREPTEGTLLSALLRESVAAVREAHPDAVIECEPIPEGVYVATVLDPVFSNLVENAAEHNPGDHPHVRVTVETNDDWVRVAVADDGPGIDEYERSVLERGAESPLMHGSGLGLWLVTWATGIAGGRVSFETNDPTGSVVSVRVPRLSPSDRTTGETPPS